MPKDFNAFLMGTVSVALSLAAIKAVAVLARVDVTDIPAAFVARLRG